MLREKYGTWTELAARLQELAPPVMELPEDQESIEKGLKRLAGRDNRPGDKYGRALLRCFGVPSSLRDWIRGLTQYHSRFADLPLDNRHAHLMRYDCPPVSESDCRIWIDVALGSFAHRRGDHEVARQRLLCSRGGRQPTGDPAMYIERALLEARIVSDSGDLDQESLLLQEAAELIHADALSEEDRICYRARLVDQSAFRTARDRLPESIRQALTLYEEIDEYETHPFALFRREHGRAWCLWKLGRHGDAIAAANRAIQSAGDGGYVRLRVQSLHLLSQILGPGTVANKHRERALIMACTLGDPDLLKRFDSQEPES